MKSSFFGILISACVVVMTLAPAHAQKKSVSQAPSDDVKDYTTFYPKSTPEEYQKAAKAAQEACALFRADVIRIDPKDKGKSENVDKTCECVFRNIAPAKDIHEVRVLQAHFRGTPLPPSVFANDPEVDVVDERPDYITHALRLTNKCKSNAAFVDSESSESDVDFEFDTEVEPPSKVKPSPTPVSTKKKK